jgi:hypothetical protein
VLYWSVSPQSADYDVVRGDLAPLRDGGDFGAATTGCPGNDLEWPVLDHLASPAAATGTWFLVRGLPGAGYDSGGPAQAGARDAEIDAAPGSCP